MKRKLIVTLVLCAFAHGNAFAVWPATPAHPCEIVTVLAWLEIPRISIKEPTTLKETLDFIYHKYRDIEIEDPPEEWGTFVFEYRLPEATLQRHVSFEAKNIKMTKAIELAFKDIPVVLTFETGKLIFSQAPPPKEALPPAAKP